jgi:dTDP-4-dehydrorhamnose reductase
MREEAIRLKFPIVCNKIVAVPSNFFPSPCKRPTYSAFDTEKIEAFLKIRPWQESLKEFLCSKS